MDEEFRRRADVQIGVLQQEFRDFRAEYGRDILRSQEDRDEMMKTIKDHDDFIRDIKPIYSKGMMAWGAFLLASVGVGVRWLWKHVTWGP